MGIKCKCAPLIFKTVVDFQISAQPDRTEVIHQLYLWEMRRNFKFIFSIFFSNFVLHQLKRRNSIFSYTDERRETI